LAVTKIRKPAADYQQWDQTELSVGDVIDVETSLGNKYAKFVTIEAVDGDVVVKFNVTTKIYKNQETVGNTWIPDAAFHTSPILADEVEDTTKEDLVIEAGASIMLQNGELPVATIKIVQLAPITRIYVH